jgi:hypothetical protein
MTMRRSITTLLVIFLGATFSLQFAGAQNTSKVSSPVWTVEIRDISPRFLDFYQTAVSEDASPDRRWELWKEKYDFAAVPPIPAGQAIARTWLDDAWPKYPTALINIRRGAGGLIPTPQAQLARVVSLLKPSEGGRIELTTFVGTFHHDAFASGKIDGLWRVAIPLEESNAELALSMTHEFTHAVQRSAGHWEGQTVGGAIFSEGLAMRVTERLDPGFQPYTYTTSTQEWLNTCQAKLPEVLRDLSDHLNDTRAKAVSNFTMTKGGAGLDREVYCAGWIIVGHLLDQGRKFSELASIPQANAINLVAQQIKELK